MADEVTLRRSGADDAGAIAAVCNALAWTLYGDDDVSAEEVARWAALPDIHTVVAETGGRIVGYLDVQAREGARYPLDVRVHPEAWGRGVADRLLAAGERWVAEHVDRTAFARGFAAEPDVEVRAALAARGYRIIRHTFHMLAELTDERPEPEWPPGVNVRNYEPGDEQRVYDAHMEAFADHWDFHPHPIEVWRTYGLDRDDFDPTLWLLAEDGDEVAGFSMNAWHFSGDPEFGWVGVLGVRRRWRRRGLGLALLRQSFLDFGRRGATRVALGVDADNTTGAVRLYERAGMRAVRRYDSYEKRLGG